MLPSTTPPVKKLEPLTTRSSSLRRVSAAEHHAKEEYSPKQAGQNPKNISQEAIHHGILPRTSSRYQDQDTKSLRSCSWKPSEDTSQK